MQIKNRERVGRSEVYPSKREVLLARLLLSLIDNLGAYDDMSADLVDSVKSIAEPIVRVDS